MGIVDLIEHLHNFFILLHDLSSSIRGSIVCENDLRNPILQMMFNRFLDDVLLVLSKESCDDLQWGFSKEHGYL